MASPDGLAPSNRAPNYADTAAYWFERGQHRRVEATARHALANADVDRASRSLVSELAGLASLRDGLSDRALYFLREAARTGQSRSPIARANLHRSLAIALLRSGHVDEADAAIQRSLAALSNLDADQPSAHPALQLDVHYTAAVTALRRAWPRPASTASPRQAHPSDARPSDALLTDGQRHLDRARTLLTVLDGPALQDKQAELHAVRAGYLALDGQPEQAAQLADRAVADAVDARTRIRALEIQSLVALHAGRTRRARTAADAALELAREHPSFVPRLLALSVDVASASGDAETARKALAAMSTADAAASSPLLRRAATSFTASVRSPSAPVMPWLLIGLGLAAGLILYVFSRPHPTASPTSSTPNADPSASNASNPTASHPAAKPDDPASGPVENPTEDSAEDADSSSDDEEDDRPDAKASNATCDLISDLDRDLGGDGAMQKTPGVPGLTVSHPGTSARPGAPSQDDEDRARWPFGVAHPDYAETPLGGSPMQPTVRPPQSALFATSGHALPAYDPSGTYLGLKHMPQQLVDEMVAGRFYVLDLGDRFGVIYRVMHGTREIVRRDASGLRVASAPFECHGLPVYWLQPARS